MKSSEMLEAKKSYSEAVGGRVEVSCEMLAHWVTGKPLTVVVVSANKFQLR